MERTLKRMEAAVHKYQELRSNLNEGLKFYVQLQVSQSTQYAEFNRQGMSPETGSWKEGLGHSLRPSGVGRHSEGSQVYRKSNIPLALYTSLLKSGLCGYSLFLSAHRPLTFLPAGCYHCVEAAVQ